MSIAATPRVIEPVLLDLITCVCVEVEATTAGPTCWCGVYPGTAVSYEFCEECANGACGMAWVRPAGIFPYNTFPLATLESGCRAPLGWSVEVGCVRCLPTPPDGELPTSDQLLEAASVQLEDAQALYRALRCCEGVEVAAEAWTPIGPEGGCLGGEWIAYLALE